MMFWFVIYGSALLYSVDLGSQNVRVAVSSPGKPVELRMNERDQRTTPNYLAFPLTDIIENLADLGWMVGGDAERISMRDKTRGIPNPFRLLWSPDDISFQGLPPAHLSAIALYQHLHSLKFKTDKITILVPPYASPQYRHLLLLIAKMIGIKQVSILETSEAVATLYSVEKLKKEQEALNQPFAASRTPLSTIIDVRLMLTEDRELTVVQAAPLELLAKLLFHPGNTDASYIPGLLVLIHTEKIELPEFVTALCRAYETTEYADNRNPLIQGLIDKWRAWFPNDLTDSKKKSQMMPIFQLIGSAGIFDVQARSHDDCQFDPHVPVDTKQAEIAFCATPHVLAEHFSYYELEILRQIPAYEFMGCGWTAVDKWTRAPRIMKMTDHFNTMSQMIVASIVTHDDGGMRQQLLERWILIMDAALKINNFQLVFEIFGALCNPALTQLQRLWKMLPVDVKKLYDDFRVLTAPSARFETYRKRLAENPPETVVPYIGPMLTSLVYISDGNPSKKSIPDVTEIVWNFSKYRTYSQTMEDVMSPWGAELKFVLNQELFTRIRSIPPVDQSEAELFQRAQAIKDL
jgi:hypothetical protein